MHPVKHSEELSILTPPDSYQLDRDESNSDEDVARDVSDADFHPEKSDWPHLINQSELSDLVRDLNLSKAQSELLGLRLQQ